MTQSQIVIQQSKITRLSRQLADHLGLEPGMLWVRIPPELFTTRPRGAARSARHPVKVEIRGSNPLGDAFYNKQRRVTQSGKEASTNDAFLTSSSVPETFVILWVRLPPVINEITTRSTAPANPPTWQTLAGLFVLVDSIGLCSFKRFAFASSFQQRQTM